VHSPSLATEVELGGAFIDLHDGTPQRERPAMGFGVTSVRGTPGYPITARLKVGYDLATTMLGELKRGWDGGEAGVRFEQLVDAEGGIFRDPNLTRRVALGSRARGRAPGS